MSAQGRSLAARIRERVHPTPEADDESSPWERPAAAEPLVGYPDGARAGERLEANPSRHAEGSDLDAVAAAAVDRVLTHRQRQDQEARARAEQDRLNAEVASLRCPSGACRFCGVEYSGVRRPDGHMAPAWHSSGQQHYCEACSQDATIAGMRAPGSEDHRHRVAERLLGTAAEGWIAPYLADRIGFRFWHELPPDQRERSRHHLDRFVYATPDLVATWVAALAPPATYMAPHPGGAGCAWCGVDRSTTWLSMTAGIGRTVHGCAACRDLIKRFPGEDPSDLFARLLVGLRPLGSVGDSRAVASTLGFTLFADADGAQPSRERWGWLDLPMLRAKAWREFGDDTEAVPAVWLSPAAAAEARAAAQLDEAARSASAPSERRRFRRGEGATA